MYYMFGVRSARALGPQALSRAFSPCMPLVCRHHTPGPPAARLAPLPPLIACPPFDSAVRDGLQPAAELRHLQRHDHELHVRGALSARALGPQALSRAIPVHAACRAATTPQALPPPGSHLSPPASHALPSTRQRASAFNQPLSFDTSSVTYMGGMFWVRSARARGPQALSRAFSPCMPLVCRHHPGALPPPSSHLSPPHRMRPPFDLAARVGLQPAAELRHLQRH
jgi:hypothetical protein